MARSWLDAFTKNWADLAENDPDPKLRPVSLPMPPAEAVTWVAGVVVGLNRWEVESADPAAATLHAIHITILWRFRDDIHMRFEPEGTGTRLFAHSQARLGKGDLGKNPRNLRELTDALRQALQTVSDIRHDR